MVNPRDVFINILIDTMAKLHGSISETEIANSVSYCDPKFGQLSTNLAFRLSKQESKPPAEVAELIIKSLLRSKKISSVEFLAPGFINIRLDNEVWSNYLQGIGAGFGNSKEGAGQSMQIEFISANPTGPLVLTNAWQGYYGGILANIFQSQGYETTTEYYLNDGGNQIASLGMAIQQSLGVKFDEEISANLYRGDYIDSTAKAIVAEVGTEDKVKLAEPSHIGAMASELILDTFIKPDLDKLGVKFDSIYSEKLPDVEKTLMRLKESGLTKEKDGAIWLNGERVGLSQDEVLIRSYDKGQTYFIKDIAYQLERLEERGFSNTITIVGPDHHGQSIRLVNTLKALGHDKFTELSTQTIRLIRDGKEFKMSKRKGNYILLDDFLDEVPTEAARFYFAMRDTNTHMDFDIDLIKEHSAKNPVYYSLYAYARACSIEEKAKTAGLVSGPLESYTLSQSELNLAIQISKIADILRDITTSHKVHQLLHQTFEVAKAFHEFYEKERVLGSDNSAQKLSIIKYFKSAYESIFAIIGVDLLEQM